jgi:hypothetical protein
MKCNICFEVGEVSQNYNSGDVEGFRDGFMNAGYVVGTVRGSNNVREVMECLDDILSI